MRPVLIPLSVLALVVLVSTPLLFFMDVIDLPQTKQILLVATIAWLVLTPLWMGRTQAKPGGVQSDAVSGD